MINKDRQELLNLISNLSERYPEWRLGQLMLNVSQFADTELWDAEDHDLLQAIEKHLVKLAKTSAA
jgi:hypothetical protein